MNASSATSRLGGLLRDLTKGLKQQMFFWGRDVVHPEGNLLVKQGFTKSPSAGLQGTSCYGLDWQGGRIELHGACVGWYPRDGGEGFLFIRPLGKCHVWLGRGAPVPGDWPAGLIAPTDFAKLHACAGPFLDWWLHSERWVEDLLGGSYRTNCYRHFKRLPKARPWLPPASARRWVARLREEPRSLARSKRFVEAPRG